MVVGCGFGGNELKAVANKHSDHWILVHQFGSRLRLPWSVKQIPKKSLADLGMVASSLTNCGQYLPDPSRLPFGPGRQSASRSDLLGLLAFAVQSFALRTVRFAAGSGFAILFRNLATRAASAVVVILLAGSVPVEGTNCRHFHSSFSLWGELAPFGGERLESYHSIGPSFPWQSLQVQKISSCGRCVHNVSAATATAGGSHGSLCGPFVIQGTHQACKRLRE